MNVKMILISISLFICFFTISCELLDEVNTSDAALELYGTNPYRVYDGTANGCDGNDDNELSQGESCRIKLRAQNNGEEDAEGVTVKITTNDNYVSVENGTSQTLGDMIVARIVETPDANTNSSILISAQAGTPNGHIAEFDVEFRDDLNNKWTDRFTMVVEPISASILLYGNNPWEIYDGTANGANGNDDGEIQAGETVGIQLRVRNEGDAEAMQVSMVASTTDSYVTIAEDSSYTFGNMAPYYVHKTPDANTNSALLITADAATPANHSATIELIFTDKFNNQWTDIFQLIIR